MRTVMILLTLAATSLTAAAQAAKPAGCQVLDTLEGDWTWRTSADQGFHRGTFSFHSDMNGKVVLAKVTYTLAQGKNGESELFIIYGKDGQKNRAQHFDDKGTLSACTIEVSDDDCKIATTCPAAVPPGYEFSPQSKDEIRLVVKVPSPDSNEKLVPWITGTARRKVDSPATAAQ